MGSFVGDFVGAFVGTRVGDLDGSLVGALVGTFVGTFVGALVGAFVGEGVLHVEPAASHKPLRQSDPERHCLPGGHAGQSPPQSTSVSVPPFAPSAHDATVGLLVGAFVGACESQ